MNTVCVVLYRLSENDVHHKGILIESNNFYSNEKKSNNNRYKFKTYIYYL